MVASMAASKEARVSLNKKIYRKSLSQNPKIKIINLIQNTKRHKNIKLDFVLNTKKMAFQLQPKEFGKFHNYSIFQDIVLNI